MRAERCATLHKNKLQRNKDLRVRPDSVKFQEEDTGRKLSDLSHSNSWLDPLSRRKTGKTQKSQGDLMKLEIFCTAKDTIKTNEKTVHRMGGKFCK